jgi:large subunit ribosomal protein L20
MRIKAGKTTRQSKKKVFRLAKGYYGNKGNRWRQVIQQVEKSLVHAYTGRKDRKPTYRGIWITRVNAACREEGISYSRFMSGLRKAGVGLNRKMLSELAIHDAVSFKKLVEISRSAAA